MNFSKAKEILTIGYWADFYIYPLFIFSLLAYGLYTIDFNIWLALILFVVGVILGSFGEYFVHRFIFHHCPIFKELHQLHHDKPIELISSPTYIALPVYIFTIFLPLCLLSNIAYASMIFSAFLLDLLYYFIIHHTTHHVKSKKGSILHWYKKYHAVHHKDPTVNFSVAFPIWDIIFRTKQKD